MNAIKLNSKNLVLLTTVVFMAIMKVFTSHTHLMQKYGNVRKTIVPIEKPITKGQDSQEKMPTLTGRWKRLMDDANNENNKAYIFFKHNRRTGGTSMRDYLENVLCHHTHDCSNPTNYQKMKRTNKKRKRFLKDSLWGNDGSLHYYELEFRAMHWDCPQLDVERWNRTLSVTIFRPPIERHLSEFFLTGSPSEELKQMKIDKQFSKEFFMLLEEEVIPWIQRGKSLVKRHGSMRGRFRDDYYVRAFAGETADLPTNSTTNLPPCYYGGGTGFDSGASPRIELNDLALMRAKKALRQFDLVLLTESMNSDPEIMALMSDVLDYPIDASAIPHKNSAGVAENKNILLSGIEKHAPKLYEIFQNNTKFEAQLYEYAKQINQEMLEHWRSEKAAVADTKKGA